ncbi:MAG TPA: DUF6493 family protein [Pirellulales bacterium]|nr:DUF6493 family protein [Pirellulales bacterium]
MTPEELEGLIKRDDAMVLAEALGPLSESERSKLSKHADALLKECNQYQQRYSDIQSGKAQPSPLMQRLFDDGSAGLRNKLRAAEVAVFALCPLSSVRKVEFQETDAILEVLTVRRPEWIDSWLQLQFEKQVYRMTWGGFWRLFKAGGCSKPTSDAYYRFLALQANVGSDRMLGDRLAEEPELLEDVWRLFEVETLAFAFDDQPDPPGRESWTSALCRLAQRGTLDRQRLLDATLKGLTTGFKNNVLTSFARVHDRLEPTIDEIAARQATYADLLNVKTDLVVAFAMTMFKKIDQAKQLNDDLFVAAAPSVFALPTKARAKSALDLLQKIGIRSPRLRPQIIDGLIGSALLHPVSDIVTAALDLVAIWRDSLSAKMAHRLAEVEVPLVAKPLLYELIGGHGGTIDGVQATVDAVGETSSIPLVEGDPLDARWRQLAGVDEALSAAKNQRWPGPLQFRMQDVPVLSGVEPIAPLESIEEISDLLAHCVEVVDSPLDVERIVDGICRLGRDVSETFERLAAPLRSRIRQLAENWSPRNLVAWSRTPVGLVRLLQWWLNFHAEDERLTAFYEWWATDQTRDTFNPPIYAFLDRRYRDLLQRLSAGHKGPLLSMPTHSSGWIDPLVFVERWRKLMELGIPILHSDVVLAALRLAPDHRAAALAATAKMDHPWMDALRWALGQTTASPKINVEQADLWIAAANARGDDESFSLLRAAGLDGAGPDGSVLSTHRWQAYVRESKPGYGGTTQALASIDLTLQPVLPSIDATQDRPSLFLHIQWDADVLWITKLLATISPGNGSAQFARGIEKLIARLDAPALANEPNDLYLLPLFDVDRPMDELACLLLLVGLSSKDEDVRRVAIDAAIESIQDGRLHTAILGTTLARLTVPEWLKLNRLCANLEEVARVSSMHAWVVCESLDVLLAAYEELPRDAHHLLAVLQKLLMQLGGELTPAAKQRLTAFEGGGKSGKLAKALLKLTACETPVAAEARHQVLQSRIERAQRWQGAAAQSRLVAAESCDATSARIAL